MLQSTVLVPNSTFWLPLKGSDSCSLANRSINKHLNLAKARKLTQILLKLRLCMSSLLVADNNQQMELLLPVWPKSGATVILTRANTLLQQCSQVLTS